MSVDSGDSIELARALAEAFLRPRRPKLADALEVVTSIDRDKIDRALAAPQWRAEIAKDRCELVWSERKHDGTLQSFFERGPKDRVRDTREAWEALGARGVIPEEWVGSQSRRFARGQYASAPYTLAGVIAVASDPEGILEAERLAREVANRLIAWGVGHAPRLVWWVDGKPEWITHGRPEERVGREQVALPGGGALHELLAAIGYSVPPPAATSVRGRSVVRRENVRGPAASTFESLVVDPNKARPVTNLLDAYDAWVSARYDNRRVKLSLPGAGEGEWVVRTVRADELPDPFEPLFLLLLRGYALLELTRRSAPLFADATLRVPPERRA
ncbi:MAG: hypothetical protein JNK05_25480 [Myxococcales bacterium]|nr:hypothetical protein [Myxococcales bacterium]